MKNLKNPILVLIVLLSFSACESGRESYENAENASADTIIENPTLNSAAATYENEKRKFIRTADLNMEVENVYQSTQNIEKKITELGGFVSQSDLESDILSTKIFPIILTVLMKSKNTL